MAQDTLSLPPKVKLDKLVQGDWGRRLLRERVLSHTVDRTYAFSEHIISKGCTSIMQMKGDEAGRIFTNQ